MGRFIKGDIVVTPFPFSDLTATKKRPALVVANLLGDDVIICLITSQHAKDIYAISLTSDDFAAGKLKQNSNIRPNRLFTIDSKIVLYRVRTLEREKFDEVRDKIIDIFK